MLDVKDAAKKARDYLVTLFDYRELWGLSLEEAELSDDGRYWLITLSFLEDRQLGPRNYKILKLDSESGDVLSMKIREFR